MSRHLASTNLRQKSIDCEGGSRDWVGAMYLGMSRVLAPQRGDDMETTEERRAVMAAEALGWWYSLLAALEIMMSATTSVRAIPIRTSVAKHQETFQVAARG
jgi:hypothetical protein